MARPSRRPYSRHKVENARQWDDDGRGINLEGLDRVMRLLRGPLVQAPTGVARTDAAAVALPYFYLVMRRFLRRITPRHELGSWRNAFQRPETGRVIRIVGREFAIRIVLIPPKGYRRTYGPSFHPFVSFGGESAMEAFSNLGLGPRPPTTLQTRSPA